MKLKILNRDKRKINVFLYTTVFIKKCVIYVLKGNAVVYLENSLIWWQIKLFPEKKKDFVTCAIVRTVFKIWLATSRSHKLLPLTVNYFVDSRIQVDKLDVCLVDWYLRLSQWYWRVLVSWLDVFYSAHQQPKWALMQKNYKVRSQSLQLQRMGIIEKGSLLIIIIKYSL